MRSTTRLGRALDFAAAHHDLLPTWVLAEEGLTPRQIADLRRDGIIERVVRGLHRLSGTRSSLQDIAAVLIRHPAAVASHTSALFLHGLDVVPPAVPHFTMPPGSSSSTTLGVLHRSPVDAIDRTHRHRLPVTALGRSLVDAAELVPVEELASVVNEAISRKLLRLPHILEAAERVEAAPGRIGSGRLRAVLATWTDEIRPDSVAEAAAFRRIRSYGLPAPVTQHVIRDDDGQFVARVDLAWPSQKVAREYDSVAWHRPDRIERDETRTQRLEALGWSVDSIHRYQLAPGEVEWLRVLRRQLHERRAAAS